jgi:GTP cyclohydrolase I
VARAFIGVGANLEPERHLRQAVEQLGQRVKIVALSRLYRSRPLARPEQPDFLNGVMEIETDHSPTRLKRELREIERALGRQRGEDQHSARSIDLDLLLYDDWLLTSAQLTLPHPEIARRSFVAVPLAELAPDLPLPGTGRPLREVAQATEPWPLTPSVRLTEEWRRAWRHPGASPSFTAVNCEAVERIIRELLVEIGEDPNREGLVRTPARVAAALEYLTSGYRTDPKQLINQAIFSQDTNNLIIARDIEIYSLCEQHLLPFFGRCHIGYTSHNRVFGLSKLARLADMHARRLQRQERMTEQIAQVVFESIGALGVGVVIEARHLCLMMRGVEKEHSVVVTSSMLGSFRESAATRAEFLSLIGRPRP